MRNPIQPTADRPFPLPDRILSDGWWLTELPGPVVNGRQHVWVVIREEGAIERDRGEGKREHFLAGA
jgi:hypothetical protein